MRILLIGYGKMGQAIAQVALQRGHQIAHKIDRDNRASLATIDPSTVDVALEFSQPEAAYDNIYQCLAQGIPVIAGTTGWLAKKETLDAYCQAQKGTFFYASNFSIGMNIFFKVNAFLAKLMNQRPEYGVAIEEIHHVAKKDAPSGTAITLAEGIIENLHRKKSWALAPVKQVDALEIVAQREKEVPGTHTVTYTAPLDTLTLQHTAHSRAGFALGAVLVAEWIQNKQGNLGMTDFLQLAD
ncbi:MAG: 4-hydroxy-tetrahydrodipicolinate reductase [Bacteroidota bacterium]